MPEGKHIRRREGHRAALRRVFGTLSEEYSQTMFGKLVAALRPNPFEQLDQARIVEADSDLHSRSNGKDRARRRSAFRTGGDCGIHQVGRNCGQARRFMTAPGVGPITALCFLAIIDDPTMRRARPYRGENPGPGKDVHGELDHWPGIREQPRSVAGALHGMTGEIGGPSPVFTKRSSAAPAGRSLECRG
jgi:hypothetical protein